jgi:hypothetical protein
LTRTERVHAIVATLMRWAFFAVMFAAAPIIANKIGALTEGDPLPLKELLKDGELFLISAAVSAAAIGEVITKTASMLALRIFVAGSSLLVILATTVWFAYIESASRDNETLNTEAIATGSIALFVVGALLGACAMIVAEISRWP